MKTKLSMVAITEMSTPTGYIIEPLSRNYTGLFNPSAYLTKY